MSDGSDGRRTASGPGAPSRLGSCRGQLVLVAAGVIAIGLLPIVLAYTQLGFGGIATTEPTTTASTTDALRAVERTAFDASEPSQSRRSWAARDGVATAVATRFDARVESIEISGIERGVSHEIERNTTGATAWASGNCPGGPNRDFGPCEAVDGVVLQERAGETHVVAIAIDLRTVAEDATYDGTYVLDAERGVRANGAP